MLRIVAIHASYNSNLEDKLIWSSNNGVFLVKSACNLTHKDEDRDNWKWSFKPNFIYFTNFLTITMNYISQWTQANMRSKDKSLTVNGPKGISWMSWELPPIGWVKLNIDGSCVEASSDIAAEGVFRDERERWNWFFFRSGALGDLERAIDLHSKEDEERVSGI